MEPVLTPGAMQEADRRTIAAGTDESVLISRAGSAVAWHARTMLGGVYGRRVVVVCGKGNNGNDGRVAARILARWGVRVDRFDLDQTWTSDTIGNALDRCDLAIDAMYGTGFRGELSGTAAIADAELYRAPLILAVDVPSGVDGATGAIAGVGFVGGAVLADETITFAALKPGLLFEPGRFHAGRVTVADIGIEVGGSATTCWTATDAASAPLERWPEDHKWSSAVMVVGGSRGMAGAPVLSALAAQRCGAGMVTVATPAGNDAQRSAPELVTRYLAATPDGALDDIGAEEVIGSVTRYRALVIGPGLGRDPSTQRAVRSVVARAAVPMVIDADALHALSPDHAELRVRAAAGLPPVLLTPHAGEYAVLSGRPVGADRLEAARALAAATGAVVLLKGPGTVVAGPDGFATIVANGGSELATAGTGDVLCGVVAAMCARVDEPDAGDLLVVAASGAWVHGDAARRTGMGLSMNATDLVAALPSSLDGLRRGDLNPHPFSSRGGQR